MQDSDLGRDLFPLDNIPQQNEPRLSVKQSIEIFCSRTSLKVAYPTLEIVDCRLLGSTKATADTVAEDHTKRIGKMFLTASPQSGASRPTDKIVWRPRRSVYWNRRLIDWRMVGWFVVKRIFSRPQSDNLERQWRDPVESVSQNRFQKLYTSLTVAHYLSGGRCVTHSLDVLRELPLPSKEKQLIFGIQDFPFAYHCWVELNGIPVNDDARMGSYCAKLTIRHQCS